jgi:hypothetical protein
MPVMFTDKEEYENYSVERPSSKMNTTSTTSTQTFVPAKKIKPVKHPGLKLKTPIAYQKDSDLSVIPIAREGMGKNEQQSATLSPACSFLLLLHAYRHFLGSLVLKLGNLFMCLFDQENA